MTDIYLIIVVILLVMLGAFFSGTETGIYRLSRFRLRLGLEQRRPFFGILNKLMADSHGMIFTTLIGANLAESFAAGLTTYIFLRTDTGRASAELYATLIMTPTLFVFAELIPKNVYFYMADILMPRLASAAFIFHRIFTLTGAVGLLKMLAKIFARLAGTAVVSEETVSAAQRHHVRQIIRETQEEGMLSPIQTQIMERLVNMPRVKIASVCVPISRVRMLALQSDRAALLETLRHERFRHIPVWRGDRNDIAGCIDIYETLSKDEDFDSLEPFVKPLTVLSADMPVIEAINAMRNGRIQIALVVSQSSSARLSRGGGPSPLGIVTMKDLVEELVGELAEW